MKRQKIILGADHAGFELKEEIKKFLKNEGYEVQDEGAHEYDELDDYPDFVIPAARKVAKENAKGVIFGGSGQGEAIAANKVNGIRAAVYYGGGLELVELSRLHNNANILSLGARFMAKEHAVEAVKLWLSTDFKGEERHVRRINKIKKIE